MKTILIVDDRVINLEFLATLLGYAGYRVLKAVHGEQALAMALLEAPALVISDIAMPVMDGIELVNRLHADPLTAHIPVIFYTATYSADQAPAMAQTFGVKAVLTKPAEPQKILETVALALALGTVFVLPSGAEVSDADAHNLATVPELACRQQALASGIDVDATPDLPRHPRFAQVNVQALSMRLAALLELTLNLSMERDSQNLLERFCQSAQNIMGTSRTAVGMHGCGQPRRSANCGLTNSDVDQIFETLDTSTTDAGVLRERLAGGNMLDLVSVAAYVHHLSSRHPMCSNFLLVPIMQGACQQGWLYLSAKANTDDFNAEDREFATTLAAQMAPLYENLTLYESVQRHVGQLKIEVIERQRVADQLAQSEAALRRAQVLTKSAHIVTANDGSFVNWSKTLPQLIGVPEDAMPTTIATWLAVIDVADRAKFLACYRAAGSSNNRMQVGYRVRHKDGTTIELHQVLEPLQEQADGNGNKHLFHTLQDVTLQKDQERRLAHLNRAARILSGINSAIVRIHDRDALFEEACRIAVNQGAFAMAWICIIDPATQQSKVVASFGGKGEHMAAFYPRADAPDTADSVERANTVDANLSWHAAARELRPVICNDINTLLPAMGELTKHGYRSLASIPLMLEEQAVAVLTLLSDELDIFDDQEQMLLGKLAGDLSFGLRFIDKKDKLSYLAFYDVLTGLPNRMLFHDRLNQFLQVAYQDNSMTSSTCVILLDLDHFSQLNDVLGRHAGDAVLLQVAQRISAALTEPYSLARISSDIFAIAVPNLQVSTDLTTLLEQQIFGAFNSAFSIDQQEIRMTARAGLALYPDDGRDTETLFKHAEIALKEAKSLGERYLYYAPQMNAALAARMKLRNELQLALDMHQFVLFYQPRVDLLSGRIVSAEALIRWQHPQRGMVPPDHFIPLAEETGLILPIGAWVIDAVCAQQTAWLSEQVAIVPVAVNLSAVQFKKGLVLQTIRDAIEKHGLEPKYIEFELTESTVMSDPKEAARNLQSLKQLNVKLALDDFGTGYSSLAYLKHFPFDFLKIDRAFVTDITKSSKDAMVGTAIIAIAHSLNLRVVAEGIETEEQLEFLRRHHCDEIQGYYFSRPVPAVEFEAMLREDKRLVLATL